MPATICDAQAGTGEGSRSGKGGDARTRNCSPGWPEKLGALSGIFGIVRRDGAVVDPEMMATMRDAMAIWGRDGSEVVVEGCAGLGHALTISTSEEKLERLPVVDAASGVIFTAEGRVDNREELLSDLEMPAANGDPARSPDGEIMFRAYQRWGAQAPRRLFGDWSFAAWDPTGAGSSWHAITSAIRPFTTTPTRGSLPLPRLSMPFLHSTSLGVRWTSSFSPRSWSAGRPTMDPVQSANKSAGYPRPTS